MPKKQCVVCKKVTSRGIRPTISCTDCDDIFHPQCIELDGDSLLAPYCCSNCATQRITSNCLSSNPAPVGSTDTSLHSQTASTSTSLPQPPFSTPPTSSPEASSDTTPSTNNTNANSKKRPASSPSPTYTRVTKVARSSSSTTSPEMAAHLSQKELDLRARRDQIESSAPEWHQLFLSDYRTECANNESRFAKIERKSDCVLQALSMTDENEIKISGIPAILQATLIESAEKILEEIGFPSSKRLIIDHREWPASRNVNDDQQVQHRTVILKLVGGARDAILRKAKNLRGKTAESIFGLGGNSPIFLSPMYPRPVYQLLREARKTSKALNYAPPIVKNLIVFMRENIDSALIPIRDLADLHALPPRNPPTQPMQIDPATSATAQ
ncbi:hypothetical protein QAD02_018287 [Eretmocerus hayati]|uniref:Uncharacterized protein n=1 Tax=Eretmocerus hayati TaxID=131215 RepID=A0ACC2PFZ3_9HYME|nr:hypothetical protein QAD02_018287 [Eretmocerus hayati]